MSILEQLMFPSTDVAGPSWLAGTTWSVSQNLSEPPFATVEFQGGALLEVTYSINGKSFSGYWVQAGAQFAFQLPMVVDSPADYSFVFCGTLVDEQATGVFIGLVTILPFAMKRIS